MRYCKGDVYRILLSNGKNLVECEDVRFNETVQANTDGGVRYITSNLQNEERTLYDDSVNNIKGFLNRQERNATTY